MSPKSVSDSDLLRFAHTLVYTTGPKLHPDDRFIKWKLFPAWRENKFASLDESKLCGDYPLWARLREFQKQFPDVPLEKLFRILQRVGAMRHQAGYLSDHGATKEQCFEQIRTLFPEFSEDLQRASVKHAYSGPPF